MLHRSTLELLGASAALAGTSLASVAVVALVGWNAYVPQELEPGRTVAAVVPQARIAAAPVSAERAEAARTMASPVPLLVPISRPTDLVPLLGEVSGRTTGARPSGGQDEPVLALASSPREAVDVRVRQASGPASPGAAPAVGALSPGATTPLSGAPRPGPAVSGADAGRSTVQTAPIPTARPGAPADRPPVSAGSVPELPSPTVSQPAPSVTATASPSASPSPPPAPSPTAPVVAVESPEVSSHSSIAEAGSGSPRPSGTPAPAGS